MDGDIDCLLPQGMVYFYHSALTMSAKVVVALGGAFSPDAHRVLFF